MKVQKITLNEFKSILKEKNISPDALQNMVVAQLIKAGKKIATAESCTGGFISKRLTEVGGVSQVFECGVCSYANEIKHKVLGVSNEDLEALGAVSPQVALQMAQGVRKLAGADYGVSTTGIAGPTGGSEKKPVGLVYIAVSSDENDEVIEAFLTNEENYSRENVRKNASDLALFTVLGKVYKESGE